MIDLIQDHGPLFWWLAAFSAALFVAGLIAVPLLLVRIPSDYFSRPRQGAKAQDRGRHHGPGMLVLVGKNILGAVLIAAGILMLVLPGQGVLTILAGLMLLSFPGKLALQRWLVSRPPVFRAINWLRQRKGRAPLQAPAKAGVDR